MLLSSQTTYHVNSTTGDDSNSGTSWLQAFATVQRALDAAGNNSQIWIAEGTYTPILDQNGNTPTDPRDATFFIDQDGMTIFGGFPATGNPGLIDRDVELHRTDLSGEIGSPADVTDNVYTVALVSGADGTTLDGLYIVDGFADGTGLVSRSRGGGIAHVAGNGSTSTLTIFDCRFFNNSARDGGALYHETSGSQVRTNIDRCLFAVNNATEYGGAIYLSGDNGSGGIQVENSVFEENGAGEVGGVFGLDDADGPISFYRFQHCTFYNNTATNGGGVIGIRFWDSDMIPPRILNCISWNNTVPNFAQTTANEGNFTLEFSFIDDSVCPTGTTCSNVTNATDPQFVNPMAGNFELTACSPAVGYGSPSYRLPFDYDGTIRNVNNNPEPGAQEYAGLPCCPGNNIVFVDQSANGLNDGSSWTNAFTDLQAAIDFLAQGNCGNSDIWVAKGTYMPSKDISGNANPVDPRTVTFYLNNNERLLGGFLGIETSANQRNPSLNETILSGNIGAATNTDNCYHVVYSASGALVDGFTVRDGRADGVPDSEQSFGGGIYVKGSSNNIPFALFSSIVQNNYAREGGGCYVDQSGGEPSYIQALQTSFFQNTAAEAGGGVYLANQSFLVDAGFNFRQCQFIENSVTAGSGGAIYHFGGGLDPGSTSLLLFDCLLANNTASQTGSALAYDDHDSFGPTIVNTTIHGNSAANGSAIDILNWSDGQAPLTILNTLMWENGANFPVSGPNYINLLYSLIQEASCPTVASCTGNVFGRDPILINPSAGNYRIDQCSPAVDAGRDTLVTLSSNDFEGDNRIIGPHPDIGYDEYSGGNNCCPSGNAYFVNASAAGLNTGQNWVDAFTSLQDALDAYATGVCPNVTQIWIAQGTYYPSKDAAGNASPTDDRDKTFYINQDIEVIGGFPNTGNPGLSDASPANPTILSGDIGIQGNGADNAYTVVHTDDLSDAVFRNLIVEGGQSNGNNQLRTRGGGWYNESGVVITRIGGFTPLLENITIRNNSASDRGAGFYNEVKPSGGQASPLMQNCVFKENSTGGKGGAIYNFGDNGTTEFLLYNPVFDGNTAITNGAAISWDDPVLGGIACSNATFYNNQVFQNLGEAIQIDFWDSGRETLNFVSCAFDENKSADVSGIAFPDLRFTDCILEESSCPPSADCSGGGHLFATDPLFVDPANGDFHLQPCSPAIDVGSALAGNTIDFEGDARSVGDAPDIGADELATGASCCPSSSVVYVDIDATSGRNDGRSWADAFTDLQDALNLISAGNCPNASEIWIAEGTYTPSVGTNGQPSINSRDNTFFVNFAVRVYGGFNGTETDRGQRQPEVNLSRLSGDIGAQGDPSDNCYSVLHLQGLGAFNLFDGLTIENGNANDGTALPGAQTSSGGGVYNDGVASGFSEATFTNCLFINNDALQGGAFYNRGGAAQGQGVSISIVDCEFSGNIAVGSGGAIAGIFASGSLQNCFFELNEAGQDGGAIFLEKTVGNTQSSYIFDICRFNENEAGDEGGVLATSGDGFQKITLTNCLLESNTANEAGGVFVDGMQNEVVLNFTSLANSSASNTSPQAIKTLNGGRLLMENSIVWNANSTDPDLELNPGTSGHLLNYSLVGNGTCPTTATCQGMVFNQDPLFVNNNGDFQLTQNSPAVDAGDPSFGGFPANDLNGDLRNQGGGVDMGCYESSFTALPVEWLYFSVVDGSRSGTARLEWATASETDNERFEIQRSSTGRAWEPIGQMTAAPTSGSANIYQWIDEQPLSGFNFYRLRQVDFDGSSDFSEVKTWVLNGTSASLIVYPNPASSEVLVEGAIEHIRVFDLSSRLVLSAPPNRGGPTQLDISTLPAGSYLLRVGSQVERFVIARY